MSSFLKIGVITALFNIEWHTQFLMHLSWTVEKFTPETPKKRFICPQHSKRMSDEGIILVDRQELPKEVLCKDQLVCEDLFASDYHINLFCYWAKAERLITSLIYKSTLYSLPKY